MNGGGCKLLEDFGKRLRAERLNQGKTQREVAAACGISESNYQRYERGSNLPNLPALEKICAALNVSASHLLNF